MHLVDVKLTFLYCFRRLTWAAETSVRRRPGEGTRYELLAHALHDISGMPVTSLAEAKQVIRAPPFTLRRRRIWVPYPGNQPTDRYYSFTGLYEAPDPNAFNKWLIDSGDAGEDPHDPNLERRFGPTEAQEAGEFEQKLLSEVWKERERQGPHQ